MDYLKIGQNIRKARKAIGLAQDELADRIDISTTHMSHIETGSTKLSLPVLVRIAEALNTSVDELLGNETYVSRGMLFDSITEILSTCTTQQVRIIEELIRAIKISFDKHLRD